MPETSENVLNTVSFIVKERKTEDKKQIFSRRGLKALYQVRIMSSEIRNVLEHE